MKVESTRDYEDSANPENTPKIEPKRSRERIRYFSIYDRRNTHKKHFSKLLSTTSFLRFIRLLYRSGSGNTNVPFL
ncbi:hypothetical protein DPV73_17560 [Leptospira mayottensis]|nr:hypothetical protein DPV73_17560 [Leptospira mayottensis]